MFDDFARYFSINPILEDIKNDSGNSAFEIFLNNYEGKNFSNGLYRIHLKSEVNKWNKIINEMYLDYDKEFICFGYDWLGRHFAIRPDTKTIVMFEPGTADVLEIPRDFIKFHDEEIPNYADSCLAVNFYNQWRKNNNSVLKNTQCVGYKIPLFLGGNDDVSNLEISDMEVYWFICNAAKNK